MEPSEGPPVYVPLALDALGRLAARSPERCEELTDELPDGGHGRVQVEGQVRSIDRRDEACETFVVQDAAGAAVVRVFRTPDEPASLKPRVALTDHVVVYGRAFSAPALHSVVVVADAVRVVG
jgi:hypothetical protein